MIRIAIVEDEADYRRQLQQFVEQYSSESGQKFEISLFSDGIDIVEGYHVQYDIILLDVEMKYMDGMTAAQEIRKVDPEVVIIFITNMAQYAIRGYSVDALDYVLKPVSYFAFSQRLNRAIARMNKRTRQYMTIAIRGGAQKLPVDDIYYIESQGHTLIFFTKDGQHNTSGTMKEMEEKLTGLDFCRCNKGYLVNLAHVDGVQNGCALVGDHALPISRGKKNEFMEALTDYLGEVSK